MLMGTCALGNREASHQKTSHFPRTDIRIHLGRYGLMKGLCIGLIIMQEVFIF